MERAIMWLKKPVLLIGAGLMLATVTACPDPELATGLYAIETSTDPWGEFEVRLGDGEGETVLTADDVDSAAVIRTDDEDYGVSVILTESAMDRFGALTGRHVGETMVIVVAGEVVAAPIVRERIAGGTLFIEAASYAGARHVFNAIRGD